MNIATPKVLRMYGNTGISFANHAIKAIIIAKHVANMIEDVPSL